MTAVAWAFRPNWSSGIVERLEWATDVLQAYKAEEQRRSLRQYPRRSFEFTAVASAQDRRLLEAAIWGQGVTAWALPIWPDGTDLVAPLAIGESDIAVTTATRDYRAGGLAVLMGPTARDVEVLTVATVTGAGIVLSGGGVTRAWPAGSQLFPAREARITADVQVPRFTGNTSHTRVLFTLEEPQQWASAPGDATYRGHPVLEVTPNWRTDPTLVLERKVSRYDAVTGPITLEDEAGMPLTAQSLGFTLTSRAAIDTWRQRLHLLRGRQGAIWQPSGTLDFVPVAPIAAGDTALDVEWSGYVQHYQRDPNRRDIRLQLRNGTVLYRRITAAVEVDANTERLALDSPLGVAVSAADFVAVSFLSLGRNAADSAELAWWTGQAAEAALTLRTFRHDL